jgi:glycosyltransferase involved in cell wall biosynthesis
MWRVLTKWVCSRASTVAPVSNEIADILISLGIPERKFRVPLFGVDTDIFYPAPSRQMPDRCIRLLFVGSLIERKGLQDLIEAMDDPELKSVRLMVIGQGHLKTVLISRAEELGLQDRITWESSVPQNQVAHIMRESDLLCLPSYMEGRPNVVNEAMASGLPVIVTRIGGIPDMVTEEKTALLFEPGDINQLRIHLKKVVREPDLMVRMGKAGRNLIVSTGVSWDATAAEFDEIFQSALHNTSYPANSCSSPNSKEYINGTNREKNP